MTTQISGDTGVSQCQPNSVSQDDLQLAASSVGVGQTWQDMTASRSLGTSYVNTTGKPIMVAVTFYSSAPSGYGYITIGGVSFASTAQAFTSSSLCGTASYIVPPGATYSATGNNATNIIWAELR